MADSSLLTKTSSNKNKSWCSSCEPDATKLVADIQDSSDIEANKKRLEKLLELILPPISRFVTYTLKAPFAKRDAEDVVQEFIIKHIVDNNPARRKFMCLYKYDRSHKDEGGSQIPFCTYMGVYLLHYCNYWDQKSYNEQDRHGTSLDTADDNAAELMRGLRLEFEINIKQNELDEAQRNEKELLYRLAPSYLKFFNAVNSLDKDKTYGEPFQDGERVVNEQKLLAYHIRFINGEFRQSPKSREYSIEQFRALSYTQVNHGNDVYLKEAVFNRTMDFMKLLEERIVSRKLTNAVFLPPEKNIRTTVNGWLSSPRMKERTDAEYAKLSIAKESFRKEYYHGI